MYVCMYACMYVRMNTCIPRTRTRRKHTLSPISLSLSLWRSPLLLACALSHTPATHIAACRLVKALLCIEAAYSASACAQRAGICGLSLVSINANVQVPAQHGRRTRAHRALNDGSAEDVRILAMHMHLLSPGLPLHCRRGLFSTEMLADNGSNTHGPQTCTLSLLVRRA